MSSKVRLSVAAAIAVSAVALSGCVSYQQYDALNEELNQAKRANEDLVRKYHQELMKKNGLAAAETAASETDSAEFQRLVRENQDLRQQLETQRHLPFTRADQQMLNEGGQGGVRLGAEGELILESDLLFSPGVARLKPGHLTALDNMARLIQSRYPNEQIIIEGHTDGDRLVKTEKLFKHNWNLGYERASSVFEYFHGQHGLPRSQFALVTYGYMKPAVEIAGDMSSGEVDEAKKQNRRVVIRRGGPLVGMRN